MKNYDYYRENDPKNIQKFLEEQKTCLLVTQDSKSMQSSYGIFNPYFKGEEVFFHLVRSDQQVEEMKATKKCTLIFQEILSLIPSYWVEENYAGAATTYYRYASLECEANIIDDIGVHKKILSEMMEKYQPEGGYLNLNNHDDIYMSSFEFLSIVKCRPIKIETKFKMGQNRSEEIRKIIIKKLKDRALGNDVKCAALIEEDIERKS